MKEAFDALGAAEHDAGPLGERERRLIKLGIAVGAESEGGVRSHVRKLLGVGVSEAEILHTIVLALPPWFPCYQRGSELGRGSLV